MNCKSCNTRIPGGANNCPNCGLACGRKIAVGSSGDASSRLAPSAAHEEIDLDEIASPVDPPRKGKSKGKTKHGKPSESNTGATVRPKQNSGSTSNSSSSSASSSGSSSGFGGSPKPAELRAMLVEELPLLERGLSLFKQQGRAVGERFETDLGEIDLLAADDGGGLVVIMIADADSKDIVTDMLGRIGWVRKHLAKTGQEVRGIVLAEAMPESAEYMAAAVADTISFKTYQISLSFSDLEI